MISVRVVGLEKLISALDSNKLKSELVRAMLEIATQVHGELAQYPGPAHRPVLWASEKQKRKYFAERNKRGLPLKYTRGSDAMSQNLAGRWRVDKYSDTTVVLGNTAAYAQWVQSSQMQTRQHKATGWITDEEAVQRNRNFISSSVNEALRRHFAV